MKNFNISKDFLRRISVVLLSLLLVFVVGCDGDKTTSSKDNVPSSSDVTSSDNKTDDLSNNSSDNTSSEEQKPADSGNLSSIDPLSGDFSNSLSVSTVRADAKEIIPTGNCASLSNPLNGYFDKEAEELRHEILNTGNTEEYYKITGTKYYISARGSDNNSGTSPDAPFRTVDALSSVVLDSGDAVLFERGSVFRFRQALMAIDGVTYGSYGEGEKPKIYASPMNFAEAQWTPSKKKNVWQVSFTYDSASNLIIDHGKEIGCMKMNLRDLSSNLQFYNDTTNSVLYMYCDKGNPAKVYKSIEVPTMMFIIHIYGGVNNVVVDNLCLKYSGWIAVNGHKDNDNITVTNCEIGYIGGAWSPSHGSRLGNAIQVWEGCIKGKFDHNWIYQTFDTAFSWQGFGGDKCSYEDISVCNNLFEYNNTDIECWDKGSTIKNFTVKDNIFRFTELGWGTRMEDGGIRGIEGVITLNTSNMTAENVVCQDNIIDCPGREIYAFCYLKSQQPTIKISNNTIYGKQSYRTSNLICKGGIKDAVTDNNTYLYGTKEEEILAHIRIYDPTGIVKWFE